MAHGVKLEIAERDLFHFAIGRMVIDPVLVAAEAVARMQHRRMLVGDPREFIEPAARKPAEPVEMRFQPPKITRFQIKPQQVAQAPIDRVEIRTRAIGGDVIGAAFARLIGQVRGSLGRKRVHVRPRSGSACCQFSRPTNEGGALPH